MGEQIRKELRDHAWSYFELHADQRLRTFDFYLVLAALIIGAAISALDREHSDAQAGLIALALPFISFVFWKLDARNKQLIKNAEEAIKVIEGESGLPDDGDRPHRLKLFLLDEHTTKGLTRFPRAWPWNAHFSYSTSFNLVFFVFGVVGLVAGISILA